jgi:hypothetical protein
VLTTNSGTTSFSSPTADGVQNGNEFRGHGGNGINRSALVALQTINGNDAGLRPSSSAVGQNGKPYHKPDAGTPLYNATRYFGDWLDFSAGYTLQRSIDPTKPVYNTEWHGAGTLSWRDEALSHEYIDFAVWLGLYHGEAMNVAWYLPRDGLLPQQPLQFNDSFAGSFGTQPAATDAYLRALLDASAHGMVVAALGRVPPCLWLLHSMSSFNLDSNSTNALLAVFEAASFSGVAVGFLFEGSLDAVDSANVVVIPGTTHARDETVVWLRHRSRTSPGTVVVVGGGVAILRYTPSGVPRSSDDTAFLATLPTVVLDTVPSAARHLAALPAVIALRAKSPGHCRDASEGANSPPPFGVLCNFAIVNGQVCALVINLNAEDTAVAVTATTTTAHGNGVGSPPAYPTRATELRTGRVISSIDATLLQLAPGEVQLLTLGSAEAPPTAQQ